MKYRVSHVPNTQKALNFKIVSADSKNQTVFNICKDLFLTWGKPSEAKLKEMMVAYVKKNGWAKEPVAISEVKGSRDLNFFITELNGNKKAKAKAKE